MDKKRIYPLVAMLLGIALAAYLVLFVAGHRAASTQPATPLSSRVQEVTTQTFQSTVLGSPVPVFMEFYAANCAPCDQEIPFINKLADEYKGKVLFVRIDAVNNRPITMVAKITAVPAHLLFRPVEKTAIGIQGFQDHDGLQAMIEKGLAPPAPDQQTPSAQPGTPAPATPQPTAGPVPATPAPGAPATQPTATPAPATPATQPTTTPAPATPATQPTATPAPAAPAAPTAQPTGTP